jgi:hypothetical protein
MQRSGMSDAQVHDEIWARRRRGETYAAIGAGVGLTEGAVHHRLRKHGGVIPRPRRRAARTLSTEEREEISRGLAAALSCAAIGRRLHRATSTITP